jgi:hypothetical protein
MSKAGFTSYRAQKASKCIKGRRRRRAHHSALPFLLKDGFDLHRAEDHCCCTCKARGSISDQSRSKNRARACSSVMILQQLAARSRCQRACHRHHRRRTCICTNVPLHIASQICSHSSQHFTHEALVCKSDYVASVIRQHGLRIKYLVPYVHAPEGHVAGMSLWQTSNACRR